MFSLVRDALVRDGVRPMLTWQLRDNTLLLSSDLSPRLRCRGFSYFGADLSLANPFDVLVRPKGSLQPRAFDLLPVAMPLLLPQVFQWNERHMAIIK